MMFINFENKRITGWHIGETLPLDLRKEKVSHIQANGDELEWIEDTFLGIPKVKKRVVIYTQPFAELIFANMQFQ